MSEIIERYRSEGFIVVEGLLSPEEVNSARDEITAIIEGTLPDSEHIDVQVEPMVLSGEASTSSRELSVRKLMGYVPHSAVLTDLAEEHPRVREILRQLLGADVKLLQDMALLKPPIIGSRKLWHQDCAYFPIDPPDVVGLWIALDTATPENGCMQVRPRTHGELIPHEMVPVENIEDFGVPPKHAALTSVKPISVPLSPGSALIFDGLLVHGTDPDLSQNRRRALQTHYISARFRFTGHNAKPAFRQVMGRSYEGCV